ncbi:MAG: hypothetical protein O3B65_07350 [Chloroflexi bacterium]|nr:hypothetical protein [Chloroflexota bacterium]
MPEPYEPLPDSSEWQLLLETKFSSSAGGLYPVSEEQQIAQRLHDEVASRLSEMGIRLDSREQTSIGQTNHSSKSISVHASDLKVAREVLNHLVVEAKPQYREAEKADRPSVRLQLLLPKVCVLAVVGTVALTLTLAALSFLSSDL